MRVTIIAGVLLVTIGASAEVRIEYSSDRSFRAVYFPDAPETSHENQPLVRRKSCRDNCLRAVISASVGAPEFCDWFLATSRTVNTDFAPVQSQCLEASRVSSACSGMTEPVVSRCIVASHEDDGAVSGNC